MAGNHSRDKGARGERAMVKLFQNYGFSAEKISRMYGPNQDISVPFLGVDRIIEVKCRADGFKQIYDWLGNNFALITKADYRRPLITMDLENAASFGAIIERKWKLEQ